MKKILLVLFLIFPIFVNAVTYSSATTKAGSYMETGDFKYGYEKYIYTPTNNSSFYNNDSSLFIKGGMLNLEEFRITLKNNTRSLYYSYLYEGNPYWTITNGSSSDERKIINSGFSSYKKTENSYKIGTKITEYVIPTTSVVGQGTYSDPFIFAPQYKVMIKVNNSERGVIVNSSNEEVSSIEFLATESDYKEIKIKSKGKYGYIGSTCGTILNDIQASTGKIIISGVTRDTECTINFGERPIAVILNQDENTTPSNPAKLYIIPENGWYSDEFANYSITTLIANPTKIGYTYKGYYKSTSASNACSGTLVIGTDKKLIKTMSLLDSFVNNQTLYPCYEANTYTITFDKNTGDVLNTTSKQIVFDQNYGELPTPEKTGYTFAGWYTDPDYGEKIVSTTKMDEAMNHTLYAHWTPNTNTTYKVRHFLQKVGAGTEQNTTNYTETTSTSHTGTSDSTVNAPRSSYTGFAQPSTKSITINRFGTSEISYYYNRNNYTVTYNANGRGTPSFSSRSVQFGAVYPLPTISATGYTFNGWFTAASGGTQVTSTTTLTNASHHTLYAHWTINKYTVTLNKGKGISAVSGAGSFNYNSIRNIDATVAPGYTWTGWTGYKNTSTKAYSFNLPAQNVTLTANATGNPYAVTYSCNGGSGTAPSPTNHIYGTASAVRTNTCSKTGFTFTGWNTAANGSGTTVGNGANITNLTTTYNGTVTLYAQWKDTTPPSCSLTASSSGVSFSSKTDNVGVSSFGLIKSSSASYNGTSSLGLSTGTFYGYVKDAAGNTSSCNIKIGGTYVSQYSKTTKTCGRNLANYTKTTKTCNYNIESYSKSTLTCYRSISSYDRTSKYCGRSVANYTQSKAICTRRLSTYTKNSTPCYRKISSYSGTCMCYNQYGISGPRYTCTTSSCTATCNGKGYNYGMGTCTANYSYYWGSTTTTSPGTCTANTFTCNSSNYGSTYITCTPNYTYYFGTASNTTVSSCSTTTFTCNSSHYNSYKTTCTANYNYAFGTASTTTQSSCTSNIFSCNSTNYGKTYVSCSNNYSYGWEQVLENVSSCSTSTEFTCNYSNIGKSYVNVCHPIYGYKWSTSSGTSNTCSTGSSFTCNSSNKGNSYVSSCTPNYNYYWSDSTTSTSSCSTTGSFSCVSGNQGSSYVSSCTPTAYACSDSGYTKINNSYCYKY